MSSFFFKIKKIKKRILEFEFSKLEMLFLNFGFFYLKKIKKICLGGQAIFGITNNGCRVWIGSITSVYNHMSINKVTSISPRPPGASPWHRGDMHSSSGNEGLPDKPSKRLVHLICRINFGWVLSSQRQRSI